MPLLPPQDQAFTLRRSPAAAPPSAFFLCAVPFAAGAALVLGTLWAPQGLEAWADTRLDLGVALAWVFVASSVAVAHRAALVVCFGAWLEPPR